WCPVMGDVYWVRHGETALNVGSERIRGWMDVPLDEEGVQQAHQVAAKLPKVSLIYSSNLNRATHTATIIAAKQSLPTQLVREMYTLRPWNVGRFTGRPIAEAMRFLAKAIAHPQTPIPDGETFTEFIIRYDVALNDIFNTALASTKPICVVTHTRNI